MDLGHGTREEKEAFLKLHADKNVLLDLTCFDPQDFYARFPQLKGVCSTLLSQNNKCEVHFRPGFETGSALLTENGWVPHLTSYTTPGFVVARTLATIINEAFFAFEEKTASQADIDRAMRFGVNYPRGPFAWAQGKEDVVVQLLETLMAKSGDDRYAPADSLRKAAMR